jgi:hypothetical protein
MPVTIFIGIRCSAARTATTPEFPGKQSTLLGLFIAGPSYGDRLIPHFPYIVALLEFSGAPGVRLITNLTGIEAANVSFGMIVRPAFDLYDPVERCLTFRPEKILVEESP